MNSLLRRCWSGALVLGLLTSSGVGSVALVSTAHARESRSAELQLRRQGNSVSLVIVGVGSRARLAQQQQTSLSWEARLVSPDASGLKRGNQQQLSLPTAGLERVMLLAAGDDYILRVVPDDNTTLSNPQISTNGEDLIVRFDRLVAAPAVKTTAALDLRKPGRVPQPRYAPPLRQRAVAPPVGDMAIGTMLVSNRSFVNVTGPEVTLTLKDAPAKDALMSLARLGGYGFVFVDDTSGDVAASAPNSATRPVTMAFRGERFDRALNSVLMASGLEGKLDGRTLLIGTEVSAKTFGPQMSKVFRLNQADAAGASRYLGNLGADITVTNTTTTTSRNSETSGTSSSSSESSTTSQSESAEVDLYGSGMGPLVGLIGTTDVRLNTITLIGDSRLISLAQNYLRQIDLRTRQVAVKVQILSVSLANDKAVESSFSARIGNTFIVSENGQAFMNFGSYKPGTQQGTGLLNDGTAYASPGEYTAGLAQVQRQKVFDPPLVEQQREVITRTVQTDEETGLETERFETTLVPVLVDGQPVYVPSADPSAEASLTPIYDKKGRPVYVKDKDPSRFTYPKNSFYSYLESAIVSSSAKTLAQPTLLIQEGHKAEVETGESVVTGVEEIERENGTTATVPTRQNAGLKVDVDVTRIDDNGFVSLRVNPEISVAVPTGDNSQGYSIFNTSTRRLSSGQIRLRDGQSLILTGVITDSEREVANKWPIFGDLPVIGQLFRSSSSSREKNELVIIVTPRILDDQQGGTFSYGYQPSTAYSRDILRGAN